jgi:uncharacterized membrane protein (GlpM family)
VSIGFDASKMRQAAPRDLLIRFVFGALVSLGAGLVSIAFGDRIGGLFLAFPAILPATLTLVRQKQSKRDAVEDDEGAVLGAAALIAFAGVTWASLPRVAGWLALLAATGAWLVAAIALYALVFGRRRV